MATATMNLNEAKTHFSNVIANVVDGGMTITITRYGRKVAQIVPFAPRKRRRSGAMPEFANKIDDSRVDWFADGSDIWEVCDGNQTLA